MDTFFASPERANGRQLKDDIALISSNPLINSLMGSIGGLLAVLNENRQILTVNNSFLERLGIKDPIHLFGLRPGEALNCVYADEMEGGCGTTKYCRSCGAAIALVASLAGEKPVERKCIIKVQRGGVFTDLCFNVTACLVTYQEHRFILLFLHDITSDQNSASLANVFFHDINNLIMALNGASELIKDAPPEEVPELAGKISEFAMRLNREMEIQKILTGRDGSKYHLKLEDLPLANVVEQLKNLFAHHPAARNRQLTFDGNTNGKSISTDTTLLLRILTNMVTNALEATEEHGEVKFWIQKENGNIIFNVWNRQAIPENNTLRIFQKYFSTKGQSGRGLGTYSMKLFSEKYLGGTVDFTTSETDGTTFRLKVPA